ncbi:MAG: hypothetical protein ACREVB_07625 [Burkholderiales bacterium]
MNERRKTRVGLKVIHRHRVGDKVLRRVSELVMIDGQPKALLGWINLGTVRTPIYLCDLDSSRLRQSPTSASTFYYDEVTVDPRFEALGPVPRSEELPPKVA